MPVASSLLAVAYVWRFVEVAYFRAPSDQVPPMREAPLACWCPLVWLLVAVVWFGLDPTLPVDAASRAAESCSAGHDERAGGDPGCPCAPMDGRAADRRAPAVLRICARE